MDELRAAPASRDRLPRVLHVMASAARGGGAAHLIDVLPVLRAAGWRCEAAVGRDGPLGAELAALGIPVRYVDLMGSRLAPLRAVRLARLTARAAPGVVHLHGTRAAFLHAAGASARRGVARRRGPGRPPVVYTAHGLAYRKEAGRVERRVSRLAERVACRGADAVVSVSRADLTDLVRRGFVDEERGFHVANAVRVAALDEGSRAAARRRLGLPPEGPVVGTVSRLVPQKAVGDLVEAVTRIAPGFSPSGPLTLVVVGDGPLRAAIGRRARAGAGGARVMLLGARGDVRQILPGFDVFALSSRWEGEPIALLEAMAAGLACVATATEGAREITGDDASCARLAPVGDVAGLGAAIAGLLRDPAARAAMGAAARARMGKRTPEAQAARLAEVYRRLVVPRFS